MRQLRELADPSTAQLLCDALLENGIEVQLLESQRGTSVVYVVEEEKLAHAQELAADWLEHGNDDALAQAAERGRATRELTARIEERRERQRQAVVERTTQLGRPKPALLTWGLIALCAAVAAVTKLGDDREMIASLLIVDLKQPVAATPLSFMGLSLTWIGLPWEAPWRLVTPMFLHFGFLHIVFNMLWLRDLGRIVEMRHGARYLALFALMSSAIPNIAQLEIARNPFFGGMSGVVYGLLGLVWLRGKLDPSVGYGLSRGTVQFMLIWLGLGFLGEIATGVGMTQNAGVANWCHLFGLLVGMAWAYVATKLKR